MTALPKTSAPASRALASVGVVSLEDLARFTRAEIADLHGMGPKALGMLEAALRELGLEFKKD